MKLTSLTIKLVIPAVLSFLFIVIVFNYMVINKGEKLYQAVVKNTIYEYVESILVAIEVDGSQSNMIRVANSIGAYNDVADVVIIDREANTISASNRNKLQNKTPEHLFKYYQGIKIGDLLDTNKEFFFVSAKYQYFLSYPARILNEDKSGKKDILIFIHASPRSILDFIGSFERNFFIVSVITFALALVIFYLLLRLILIIPIHKITTSIEQSKHTGEPELCDIDSDDELGQLASSFNQMIMEKHDYQQILEQASNTDPLTGLANRRHFEKVLKDEWNRAIRGQQAIAIIIADVDHFKKLNDTHGHLVGDQCLINVAKLLHESTKRSGDMIARFGGEEFAIILPDARDHIWVLAETYRAAVEKHTLFVNDDQEIKVTISLGLASLKPHKDQKPERLIDAADKALYQAKASGRNMVVVNDLIRGRTIAYSGNRSNVIPMHHDS